MNMKRIVIAFLFFLLWSFEAQAQAPFYQGKTIRIVVGFSPGGSNDLWSRLTAQHMGRYVPGNPETMVQNMPGGGSMIAANYVYNLAKPDGLTLGNLAPALYFEQLMGRKEAQFDWSKFTWIGSPEQTEEVIYIRSDTPYKTIEDIRKAQEPPRCGAAGIGSVGHYFPKLLEEILDVRFNVVVGYPGAAEVHLAIEKGELHCRTGSISSFFDREPGRTWAKTGFVRALAQGGKKRDPRLPDVPTIYELMDRYRTPDAIRRLAKVLLSPGTLGRPMVSTPGIPPERVKILREAYMKALNDPQLLADVKRRGWEASPVSGAELETIAKEVIAQPVEVIERMRGILGK
jgi:tripartite-type tricarboxylate transporter receptor subunit TctC